MKHTSRSTARFLDLLSHVSEIVSSSKSLDAMLSGTVGLIKSMLEIDRCSIMILDPETQVLRIKAASGIDRDVMDQIRIMMGHGVSGRVAQSREPLLVEDTNLSHTIPGLNPQRYATSSFISVPMVVRDRVVGVINVNNSSDAEPFASEQLELMVALAGFIALTIENSGLLMASENLRTHLENLVESLSASVMTVDLQRHILLCNARMTRLIGLANGENVEGKGLASVLPPSLFGVVNDLIQETVTFRNDVRTEVEFDSPVFGRVTLEIATSALSNSKGTIDGAVLTMVDVSERREIAELKRIDEMKSSFMSLVSHELRTPLTSMKGSIHLLRSGLEGEMTGNRAELLDILQNNTERLTRLVNNLLDVVHIESQTLSVVRRLENLRPLVESAIRAYTPAVSMKRLHLVSDLADVDVPVDRDRMYQVVSQLLDNAVKFTAEGGSIFVTVCTSGNWAQIVVRDTGCGIKHDFQPHLFTRFAQPENPLRRTSGGTGIGLYIARAIVEMHGGHIDFRTEPDQGTEFTLELPLVDTLTALDEPQ